MEEWKDIKGFEGLYKVSNYGNIMSVERYVNTCHKDVMRLIPNRLLVPHKTKTGYLKVWLYRNGKKKKYSVHRLVAMAFIDNPENKPCVNHIDNNRENNNVNNLEWCTYKENSQWAEIQGRREFTKEWREKISATRKTKPVIGIDDEGNEIFFAKVRDVIKEGFDPKAIIRCCKGLQHKSKGYTWKYVLEGSKSE